MSDSGIEVDIMSLLNAEDDPVFNQPGEYYELKSKVVVGSPLTEIKHAHTPLRTSIKQHLQRQQILEQERREQQLSQSMKVGQHVSGSQGISVPRVVEAAEVPTTVLQVKTKLQHPTKYHVRESQKRQVEHFLSEHHGGNHPIQSLPANICLTSLEQQYHIPASSSAPEPDLTSLGAASADFLPNNFDLLSDLQSVDPLELNSLFDNDFIAIEPTLGNGSIPHSNLLQGFESVDTDTQSRSPSSCPTTAYRHTDIVQSGISVQDELWRKERIKKDNHNMIERRRRFNINDRIKELGLLLPKTIDPDLRQNKGSILKASVDYIKTLQDDQRKYKMMLESKKKDDLQFKKLCIQLQQMQTLLRDKGIDNPLINELDVSKNFLMPETSMVTSIQTHQLHMPSQTTQAVSPNLLNYHAYSTQMDDMMDESSPVSGDPMLMSAPGSPEPEDHLDFSHF